jgi:tetratricopeptide (TPR) repeat protein
VRIYSALSDDYPNDPYYLGRVGTVRHKLARYLYDAGNQEQAIAELRHALAIYQRAVVEFPDYQGESWFPPVADLFKVRQSACQAELGFMLINTGRDYREAAALLDLPNDSRLDPLTCTKAAMALTRLIDAARQDPHLTEVELTAFRERRQRIDALWDEAIGRVPDTPDGKNQLAWMLVANISFGFGHFDTAVELAQQATKLAPQDGNIWNTLGVAQYRAGNWPAVIEALGKSNELRRGGDASDFFFLAMAHWQLGHKEEAGKWYDQAVVWMETNNPNNEELCRFRAEATELLGLVAPTKLLEGQQPATPAATSR